jgi:hypothetical protein
MVVYRHKCVNIGIRETGYEVVGLAEGREQWWGLVNTVIKLWVL